VSIFLPPLKSQEFAALHTFVLLVPEGFKNWFVLLAA
jgi:hypothetical protein